MFDRLQIKKIKQVYELFYYMYYVLRNISLSSTETTNTKYPLCILSASGRATLLSSNVADEWSTALIIDTGSGGSDTRRANH